MSKPTVLHNPGNDAPVKELYAYLSVDGEGNEGVIGGIAQGVLHPLVTSKRQVAMAMHGTAKEAGLASGMAVKLYKFTKRELVGTVVKPSDVQQ